MPKQKKGSSSISYPELSISYPALSQNLDAQAPSHMHSKARKLQLRRQNFLQRFQSSHEPYSKSYARRLKRKSNQELASGLSDISRALPDHNSHDTSNTVLDINDLSKGAIRAGQIGSGRATPLSASQRKRALQTEKLRHPFILSTPEFAANPFQTIRTHANNTLIKRIPIQNASTTTN